MAKSSAEAIFTAIIRADAKGAVTELRKVNGEIEKNTTGATSKLDQFSKTATKAGMIMVSAAGAAGIGLAKLAQGASNLAESVNAVQVTFGDAADGILELGSAAAETVGLSKAEFNGLAVQFSSFAKTVAGDGGNVIGTMDTLTTRVADFASVMNLDVPEAARIFQSALAGETEPIKKFGIDLSAASVAAFAVAEGISESASSMTEAEKVQARYGLLMEQTSQTAGDFANTSDGLANQQRILSAQFKNLTDGIGTGVLPMLTEVVSAANRVVGAFSSLSPETQGAIGKFAALGVAGLGTLGTLSLIAGQAVKMRDRFTTLGDDGVRSLNKMGKAARGLGVSMGVATLAVIAWELNNKRQNDSMADSIRLTEELGRVSLEELGGTFRDSVASAVLAGKSLEDAMAGLAAANLEGAMRVRDNAEAIGLSELHHDALNDAINAEIVARKTQTDVTAEYTEAELEAGEATAAAVAATMSLKEAMEGGIDSAEVALQAQEALVAQQERNAEAAELAAEALTEQADVYAENAMAALTWMEDVQGSMESAAGSIATFSDESMASIDAFQQELSTDVEALHNWQDDIIAIAAATSPEFAGFLAEMGLAGAGVVDALANNLPELETTFGQWKYAAEVAARDVPGEIAKADPETQRIIERLGKNVISTLDGQVSPTQEAGRAVGQAIVDGMRVGVEAGAQSVGAAAAATVTNALAAARNAGDMHSPSRLFADEVGLPIVEGIEEGIIEGASKIAKALERAIQSAEKDALRAVDDLVDAASDRFKAAWGMTDDQRDLERLNERIADAQGSVSDAQTKVNEAVAEFGFGSAQHLDALESLSDAERSLRDANYDLLKASEDLIAQGPAGEASFHAIGAAAGLTRAEIDALILSYRELAQAERDAAAERAAIAGEAAAAQNVRARFGQAAAAGLVPQEWIGHIAQFADNPGFTLDLMRAFLDTLPNFDGGGTVPGMPGSPQLVIAHGGERISPVGTRTAGGTIINVNVAVQTLDGTIGAPALAKLTEAINQGVRTGKVKLVS